MIYHMSLGTNSEVKVGWGLFVLFLLLFFEGMFREGVIFSIIFLFFIIVCFLVFGFLGSSVIILIKYLPTPL